jgi:pimeloyl-ACP methyl ester carboxylesterase
MAQHYVLHQPKGAANPPTLMILPGVNSGAYLFMPAIGHLGLTHRIVILNPPGVAGVPMPVPFTAASYARYALKVAEALEIESFDLLGHSLGGFAAQELARLAPGKVNRLVLVSTSPGQPGTAQDIAAMRARTGKTYWDLSSAIEHDPHANMKVFFGKAFPVHHPEAYDHFIAQRQKHLPGTAVSFAQLSAGGLFTSARWAHKLDAPALVLHGGADILVSPAGGRLLSQLLPHARYMEFYDVGHFPMLEHPGFYPAVQRFLGGFAEGIEPPRPRGFWQRLYDKWFVIHG